jgi:hypothetical protein
MSNLFKKSIVILIIAGSLLTLPSISFALPPYDIIIKKDIFDENRGANKNPAQDNLSSAAREQLNKYQLVGIIKIANKIEGAYIKPAPDGKPDSSLLLKKGNKLEGWTVEDIKEKSIILKSGEDTFTFSLFIPEKGNRKGSQRLGFVSTPAQTNFPNQDNQPQRRGDEADNPQTNPDSKGIPKRPDERPSIQPQRTGEHE